jgi:sterol desaturase/sphingolipid hydroxylase (fatty acid hydroxylase superfamily)
MAALKTPHGRIFKNNLLEKLTKSSPRLTALFYSALLAGFFYLSYLNTSLNLWQTLGIFLSGVLLWTLIEYILHRYIFHIDDYFPVLKRLHYIFHGVHHENPRDHERLFMPPVPGAMVALFLFGVFFLVMSYYAFALMAGISTGYLLYSYIHYMVHTRPSKLWFHKLWIHHLKHHHKFPDKAYGVSSPLWDIIFGTMPPENTNETRHFSR